MTIYVTKRDCDEGIQAQCERCPVAIATKREAARRGWGRVSVGATSIYFIQGKVRGSEYTKACARELPAKAVVFIREFDTGKLDAATFAPFAFTIPDIPDLTAGNPG